MNMNMNSCISCAAKQNTAAPLHTDRTLRRIALRACLLIALIPGTGTAEPLQLDGLLREGPPCDLFPGDENVQVNFGSVANRDIDNLGEAGRTDFDIRLINCDLTQASSVTMTLSGTPSSANQDWLAPAPDSLADGLAIAIMTRAGDPVPLGQATPPQTLVPGTNRVELSSVVKDAASTPVVSGAFNASADFLMEYP
jgi:type 1 fimbria pilin